MRDRGILLLRAQQLCDTVGRFAGTDQSEPVIDSLARRRRRQVERFLEFVHRLLMRGGVFVERFAEIAMVPERVAGLTRYRSARRPDGQNPRNE